MSKKQKTYRNKIKATFVALLILSSFAFMAVAFATGEKTSEAGQTYGPGGNSEVPGAPDDAVQYNKTDITPVAQMEQVMAGEPTLFCYRNTTMLMNCTRNCSLIVTIDSTVKPKLFGFSIDPNQTMTLMMNLSGSPLNGERVVERTLNFYWGIEPNATLQLRGQIRLHINQTELNQELNREVNASRLTWMYWNRTRSEWEAVPSYIDQDGYLTCNTDHFSVWTVAELSDTVEAVQNGVSVACTYAIVAAVVIIVAVVGISVVKKRR